MPTPYRLYVFGYINNFYKEQVEKQKEAETKTQKIPNFKPFYPSKEKPK